jgi:alpha-tubulin suppressor-like RCC1 family protein
MHGHWNFVSPFDTAINGKPVRSCSSGLLHKMATRIEGILLEFRREEFALIGCIDAPEHAVPIPERKATVQVKPSALAHALSFTSYVFLIHKLHKLDLGIVAKQRISLHRKDTVT